jgi:hypothetical protein
MSHLWIYFRGIYDDFNRKVGIDYFENSRQATLIHRQYGVENPMKFPHYNEYVWGLTASDGPGPAVLELNGVQRKSSGMKHEALHLAPMTAPFHRGQ